MSLPGSLRWIPLGVLLLLTTAGRPAAQLAGPEASDLFPLRRWPMFGHDSRHTGRMLFPGAQTRRIRWVFPPPAGIFATDPVIADDGTIYVGDPLQCDFGCTGGSLYAVNPDGSQKWSVVLSGSPSTSAIASDGTVYVPVDGFANRVVALHSDSSVKWDFEPLLPGLGFTPITLGPDGTTYFGRIIECPGSICNAGGIYALDPAGELKFHFLTDGDVSGLALGQGGTVYFGTSGPSAAGDSS